MKSILDKLEEKIDTVIEEEFFVDGPWASMQHADKDVLQQRIKICFADAHDEILTIKDKP